MTRLGNMKETLLMGGSTDLEFQNPVLEQMYRTRSITDPQGKQRPLLGAVTVPQANALYRTIRQFSVSSALEVGMAYGGSTMSILSALEALGAEGLLISVDPGQSSNWDNIGVAHVQQTGFAKRHKLIEELDYLALPKLLEDGVILDFAYIDGWHTFDYTLLDFFYLDRMLKVGGVVAFNDCYLPAVKKVLGFLRTHRRYKEIDVGLKPSYLLRSIRQTARNIVTLTSTQDRYFQKQEAWEPDWNFYASF